MEKDNMLISILGIIGSTEPNESIPEISMSDFSTAILSAYRHSIFARISRYTGGRSTYRAYQREDFYSDIRYIIIKRQDTIIKAIIDRKFTTPEDLWPYISRLVSNACKKIIQKENKRTAVEKNAQSIAIIEDISEEEQAQMQQIKALIDNLEPDEKEILNKRIRDSKLAEKFGVTENTIRTRRYKINQKIIKSFREGNRK